MSSAHVIFNSAPIIANVTVTIEVSLFVKPVTTTRSETYLSPPYPEINEAKSVLQI